MILITPISKSMSLDSDLLSDCWSEIFLQLTNHVQGYMALSGCSRSLLSISTNSESIEKLFKHLFAMTHEPFRRIGIPILSRYHRLKTVKLFLRARETWAVLWFLRQTADFEIPEMYDLQNMLACEALKEGRYLTRPFRSKIIGALQEVDILPRQIYQSFRDEASSYLICAKRFCNRKLTRRLRSAVGVSGVLLMIEVPLYFLAMMVILFMDAVFAPSIAQCTVQIALLLSLRYIFTSLKDIHTVP